MTRAHSTRKQDFVRTQPLSGDESFIPNAQSDVHLRDCGVLRHITNHSGSAQDCFADGCSDGRVPHVAKASTPSSNREMVTKFAGAMTRAQSKRKQEFVRTVIVIPACVFKIPRATIYYSTIKFHYQNMHLGLGIV